MRLGITGHRGLPERVEQIVRAVLDAEVERRHPETLTAVSCIADGPDAWLAQSVLERGGELEIVVPAACYREGLPTEHHATYDELMRRAREIHSTGLTESTSEAHMAGSEILVGLADELIAVWDGKPARGYGGTADVVASAERSGVPVHVVRPDGAARG